MKRRAMARPCEEKANLMIDYKYEKGGNIGEAFGKLYEILSLLRSPEGCPWDRKETPQSAIANLKSELFEALDEVVKDDVDGIVEETGDILLNAVMLMVILKDIKGIDPERIVDATCRKLVSRHPHVFTNGVKAANSEDALQVWNSVKKAEGKVADKDDFFSRIPKSCGTYERAGEVLGKAIDAGFTWEKTQDVLDQAASEIEEVRQEAVRQPLDENLMKMEMGDMIFSALAVAKYVRQDPEACLRLALSKFEKRFNRMRDEASRNGIRIEKGSKFPLDVLDRYWREAKKLVDEESAAEKVGKKGWSVGRKAATKSDA